jgi:peptidoglycan hydrolase-like protein with peptidoglycan-binding domain
LPPLSFRSSLLGVLATFVAACLLFVPAMAKADSRGSGKTSARLGAGALQVGDQGAVVKDLQRLLARAGFATTADGQFGKSTAAVVRRFQRAANLRATGVADPGTIAALRRAADGSATVNSNGGFDLRGTGTAGRHLGDRIPLREGMSGHDVRILQDFLRRAGFETTIDGEFGAGTTRTVKEFEANEQVEPNGIVDAADIDLLRSVVASGQGAGPAATTVTTATPGTTATPSSPAPLPLAPGDRATVGPDGLAVAPSNAPDAVKQIIAAGNEIAQKPYVYGGGHGKWQDRGYDCSGSVSYALHGAGLLTQALSSGDFASWGEKGPGQWVTIYANGGHVYMVVAGLRFDTSGRQQDGTRWHAQERSTGGYTVVHPPGL